MIWNKVYFYCSILVTLKFVNTYENNTAATNVSSAENMLRFRQPQTWQAKSRAVERTSHSTSKTSYIIGKEQVDYATASIICQQIGMMLATPLSEQEERDLEEAWKATRGEPLVGYGSGIWIGGKRCKECLTSYYWEPTAKPLVYSNFLLEEPSNSTIEENCLQLVLRDKKYSTGLEVGWNNYPCDEKLKYACQSRPCREP